MNNILKDLHDIENMVRNARLYLNDNPTESVPWPSYWVQDLRFYSTRIHVMAKDILKDLALKVLREHQ